MNKKQFLLGVMFASILSSMIVLGAYQLLKEEPQTQHMAEPENRNIRFSSYPLDTTQSVVPKGLNFIHAAKVATPGVVHIRSTFGNSEESHRDTNPMDEYLRQFFGNPHRGGNHPQRPPAMGSGSGVLISEDGYIATNNHVIEDASEIEVLLDDNRTYQAEVVGTDPTTDLALLKIEAESLPLLKIGDSDKMQVGEWVLAVGNPFGFRSTVTAGIVSAKGRSINILRRRSNNGLQIESFIQTDAAVNPGNSGGALVNLKGELIGINTAIATPTGAYAGYSFAVPSNLAHKVLLDLKEFGVVQRALLGISIKNVNAELAKKKDLKVLEGVYVEGVNPNSGANEAGIQTGDVIVAVMGEPVSKVSELQEKVALNRPGDKIKVTLIRDGKEKVLTATLKNTLGTTATVASANNLTINGATFADLSKKEKEKMNLKGGVKVVSIDEGRWKEAGIRKGFIITSLDKKPILSVEDFHRVLEQTSQGTGFLLEGRYENGEKAYYGMAR